MDFKVSTFVLDHPCILNCDEHFMLYGLLKRLMDSYALSGINPCRIKGPTKMNFVNPAAVQPPQFVTGITYYWHPSLSSTVHLTVELKGCMLLTFLSKIPRGNFAMGLLPYFP